jgi:phosphatidylethanolamine-binding protein (PEBP) family uncharacterized protein
MVHFSLLASIALLSLARAQSADHSLDVKAIEAHFSQSGIVPQLLAEFQPVALVSLTFQGVGSVTPGQLLTKEQVSPTPALTVTPANASVQLNGNYTLAMVDADVVGSDISGGVTRHWLVNGVTISSGSSVSNASATAITPYAGPWPAAGSGPHRYVVLLYEQPSSFSAPDGFSEPLGVSVFDFNAYVKDSGLGNLVAGTYIQVEEGTATVSLSATSAVVSSTLSPSSSSSSSATSTAPAASQTGNTSSGASGSVVNWCLHGSVFAAFVASLF